MIAVIDCNSLLSLARYYLPNDKKNKLYEFLKRKIVAGEILVIDKILNEAKFNSKGLAVKKLDFLDDKLFCRQNHVGEKTDDLIPVAHEKFYRMVDDNFSVKSQTQKLTEAQYNVIKNEYLNSADCKLIVKALNLKKSGEEVVIVTEETMFSNDKKLFKKIPAICKILEIKAVNIQEFIEMQHEVIIEIN